MLIVSVLLLRVAFTMQRQRPSSARVQSPLYSSLLMREYGTLRNLKWLCWKGVDSSLLLRFVEYVLSPSTQSTDAD